MVGPAVTVVIARTGVPIVYDFDDPIGSPTGARPTALFSRLKWPRQDPGICRWPRASSVGNRLGRVGRARIRGGVDVVRRAPSTSRRTRSSGAGGWPDRHARLEGAQHLALLESPWGPSAGWRPPPDGVPCDLPHGRVRHRRLPRAIDLEALERGDRGHRPACDGHRPGPVPDTGWTPWRCHGKVLQYMAAGIPTVTRTSRPPGLYPRRGENGSSPPPPTSGSRRPRPDHGRGAPPTEGPGGRKTSRIASPHRFWSPKVGRFTRPPQAGGQRAGLERGFRGGPIHPMRDRSRHHRVILGGAQENTL